MEAITLCIRKGNYLWQNYKRFRRVIAAETKISSIIDSQLTYAGYDIDDLAENALFEEVVFLLWNYRLPTQDELDALRENFIII